MADMTDELTPSDDEQQPKRSSGDPVPDGSLPDEPDTTQPPAGVEPWGAPAPSDTPVEKQETAAGQEPEGGALDREQP
ncbi:hypothetical protein P5G50_00295 [Leifsonia sp. F6_8S_P_1B]|uniref:Uncharacterized protein n=1 Tax=Leifsonia williamsii TaxID=3035919 RepID=A0ABT8K5Y4_9MICO|nr:hypothetical protein [Leifsonia williamsii]MDN4612873.1 hypothetical protein [Leifsonia williamsii]